jgi:hypothetical protein
MKPDGTWFRIDVRAWLRETQSLSLEESGAVFRCSLQTWIDPPGAQPQIVADVLHVPRPTIERLWPVVRRYFEVDERGRLASPMLNAERQRQSEYHDRQARNGARGGRALWTKVARRRR